MEDKIMKQEEKNLFLKDLCSRLPYGVKLDTLDGSQELDIRWLSINMCNISSPYLSYLFPLSNMTEEQYEEFINISGWDVDIEDIRRGKFSCIGYVGLDVMYDAIDWFNKNHFDYRGLIPMGLAIDATGKNIY